MPRFIIKWIISRAIDEDQPLPDWVRRTVDRDEELKQFERNSLRLCERLKHDAPGWIAAQAVPEAIVREGTDQKNAARPSVVSDRRRVIGWSLSVAALAACILFVVFNGVPQINRQAQPVLTNHPEEVPESERVQITDADREWLVQSLKNTQKTLDQVDSLIRDLPDRTANWKLPPISVIADQAESIGSTAGHALVVLDRGMASEQKRLKSEVQSAVSFFTRRLPDSMARLAGLRPAT
jgi:hypothetical protein